MSAATRRTAAPWHAGSFNGTTHYVFAGSGKTRKAIASVYNAADAPLMAAAPKLHAACVAVEAAQRGGDYAAAFDAVRDALAEVEA